MSFDQHIFGHLNCAQATKSCEGDATKLAKGFARTVSPVRRIFERLAYYGSAASNATDQFNSSSLSTGFLMDPMDPLNAIEQS